MWQTPNIANVMIVAVWIGIAHIAIGVCILFEPTALLVTAFAGLKWVMAIYGSGDKLGGLLLITAGALAVAGGHRGFGWPLGLRFKLIAPQVVLLVFTVSSIMITVIEGRYPDGYTPEGGTLFIASDQAIAGFVSLFHIVSVLLLPMTSKRGSPHDTV